jgi:hypothetical protein
MYGKPAITCFKYQAFLYGSEAITYLNAVSHPWCEHFYQLLSSRYNTEKGGGKGCSLGLLGLSRPFPPHTHPPYRIIDRFWQPRPKSRKASILETVSMVAEFGQQQ